MKTIHNILAGASIALLSLTACDDPYTTADGGVKEQGKLSTSSIAINVKNADAIGTRAVSTADFTVNVKYASNSALVKSWRYADMPGVVTLDVANYTIEAYNAEPVDAAFEAPYYYGSTDVEIKKNELTDAGAINCSLSNVMVSVRYSDKLKAVLGSDVKVTVKMLEDENRQLVYSKDEGRAGYFKYEEGVSTLVAELTGTVKGFEIKENNSFKVQTDVKPGYHHIITFDFNDTPGIPGESGYVSGGSFSIGTTVQVVDFNANLDINEDPLDPDTKLTVSTSTVQLKADGAAKEFTVTAVGRNNWYIAGAPEWLTITPAAGGEGSTTVSVAASENESTETRTATFKVRMAKLTQIITVTQSGKSNGGDDPNPPVTDNLPTIISNTVALGTPVIFKMVEDEYGDLALENPDVKVVLLAKAPLGIKHFDVTIDSEKLTPEELVGVQLTDKFDLAAPGQYEGALKGFGFPVGAEVEGCKEELTLDISKFVPLLALLGPGESKFLMKITDAEDNECEVTLILKLTL